MARNIPNNENHRPATKATLPNKALDQDRRPNKELPRLKKHERIHLHHNSCARDAKGTALRRWRKRARETGTQVQRGKMNKYLSIINLSENGLNATIKRHRIAEWIRNHDPHICCLQRPTLEQDLHRLTVKNIHKKFTWQKSQGMNTYITQNRLQNKTHKKGKRRSPHNT